jgi:hypothetical protein
MKVRLTKYSSGDCIICTVKERRYISAFFYPDYAKGLYLQSCTNSIDVVASVLQRVVTVNMTGLPGVLMATCKLTTSCENSLRCMISVNKRELRFEQGLSFQSSRNNYENTFGTRSLW